MAWHRLGYLPTCDHIVTHQRVISVLITHLTTFTCQYSAGFQSSDKPAVARVARRDQIVAWIPDEVSAAATATRCVRAGTAAY